MNGSTEAEGEGCYLHIQTIHPETIDKPHVQAVVGVAYSIIFCLGILGNAGVFRSHIGGKGVQLNVRKVFILSLALADTLMLLVALPLTCVYSILREWMLGDILCKLVGTFQAVSVFCSSFTFTAIAVDRYLLVVHPGRNFVTYSRATGIIVGIWVSSTMIALPSAVFSRTESYAYILMANVNVTDEQRELGSKVICGETCTEQWPRKDEQAAYSIFLAAIQFVLPFLVTSISYFRLIKAVRQQITERRQHGGISEDSNRRLDRRKRCTTNMTLAMILIFITAWMPINIFNILDHFKLIDRRTQNHSRSLYYTLCHITAMISAASNPIVYSWFNEQFRELLFAPCTKCRRPSECVTVNALNSGGQEATPLASFNAKIDDQQ